MRNFLWRFASDRGLHARRPGGHLAAPGEAEAGHRPLGRDDPGLRGRHVELAPRLQHGRTGLRAEEARRPGGREGNPDPQDRQQSDRDHPAAGERRGGRRSQEDAGGRRRARVPHPRQPEARRGCHARALGPGGLAKPPSRYRWARLGEISTGTNPTMTSETPHRPPADVEEGPLCRHRGLL